MSSTDRLAPPRVIDDGYSYPPPGNFLPRLSRRWAELQAAERGCHIVDPKDDELFIDIDTAKQLARFHRTILTFLFSYPYYTIAPSQSREPNHFHIVVKLRRKVWRITRILLQLWLGSDPRREWLSLQRLLRYWGQQPTYFFEKMKTTTDAYR